MRLPSILKALKPQRSQAQHYLEQMVGSEVPPAVREALAVKEALSAYAEPQDRRTFFKNVLGLPQRGRQISRAKALIEDELAGNEVGGELDLMMDVTGIDNIEDLRRYVQEYPSAGHLLERAEALKRGSDSSTFDYTDALDKRMQEIIKSTVLPEEEVETSEPLKALREALSRRFRG